MVAPAPARPPPIMPYGSPVVVLTRLTRFQIGEVTAMVAPSGDRATPYGLNHIWYVSMCRPVASSMACTLRLLMSATYTTPSLASIPCGWRNAPGFDDRKLRPGDGAAT